MNHTDSLSVLIAEDDAIISGGIAVQLSRLGYAVAGQAYDGPQAVELASRARPSVVLMDVRMVDPDTGLEDPQAGLKAARTIQENWLAAVVLLTAYESPDLIRDANQAGVSGYLVKPAGDNDLHRALIIGRGRYDALREQRARAVHWQQLTRSLEETLAQVHRLAGLLPICANCKKIRDKQGQWHPLETYIEDHSSARFSHGFCPECFQELYPNVLPEKGH